MYIYIRIRALRRYARDDTHYLLFIYDCLRRELWRTVGQSGYMDVLNASRDLCASRYEKPRFYPLGYRRLVQTKSRSRRLQDTKRKLGVTGMDSLSRLQVSTRTGAAAGCALPPVGTPPAPDQ
jgi:hypothetical protein